MSEQSGALRARRHGAPAELPPQPKAAGSRSAVPVTVRFRPRPGRLGPLRLPQLILVELAAALVLIGLATNRVVLTANGVVAVLLVLLALLRWNGLSFTEHAGVRAALQARRRRAAANPVDPQADPLLVPVLECDPALRIVQHTVEAEGKGAAGRRERREIGMVGDGTFLTAVLQVEAPDEPLRPGRNARSLPLELLGAGLVVDDIVLDAIQVVQYAQPAPAPHLPEQALAARGYRELPGSQRTPGLRLTWVTVRLDPELCLGAVAARGGGDIGARKSLQRAADQLAARLAGAGLPTTVLDAAAVAAAVSTAVCANPLAAGSAGNGSRNGRRTAETTRAWRCDDRWHTTYWVGQWPRLAPSGGSSAARGAVTAPDLVNLLTGGTALGTTFSLTVRQADGDAVALTGQVRVTARGDRELEQAARQLEARAKSAGATLVRLDREQVPGVLATLPLGGTR